MPPGVPSVKRPMPIIAVAPARHMDDYLASLKQAGADELVLEYGRHDADEVADRVGGVVLLGGGDVDPRLYGETPHASFEPADAGRDSYEIALARAAVARDVPLLAICRGLQVLNVALGGTLVQDIPTQVPRAAEHSLRHPKDRLAHTITVRRDTRLHDMLGSLVSDAGICEVNSRHHQSVKVPGQHLVVSATAPDGVVEAAEDPRRRFCVGVQWHPENFCDARRFQALFDAFVRAASTGR
jgi:putative glutamine amidotransferase